MSYVPDLHSHTSAIRCLQDHLRRLAVQQGSLMVGTQYWAKQALTAVLSHLQANSMKQILHDPAATYRTPELGALMVVSCVVHTVRDVSKWCDV